MTSTSSDHAFPSHIKSSASLNEEGISCEMSDASAPLPPVSLKRLRINEDDEEDNDNKRLRITSPELDHLDDLLTSTDDQQHDEQPTDVSLKRRRASNDDQDDSHVDKRSRLAITIHSSPLPIRPKSLPTVLPHPTSPDIPSDSRPNRQRQSFIPVSAHQRQSPHHSRTPAAAHYRLRRSTFAGPQNHPYFRNLTVAPKILADTTVLFLDDDHVLHSCPLASCC